MAKFMKGSALTADVLSVVLIMLSMRFHTDVWLSLAITFCTIGYHFSMRLLVGLIFDKAMNNMANYNLPWFQVSPREQRFYDAIGVKKWKNRMPTYDADQFSPQAHSWDEIAQAMCQAELVHETIIVLSFAPLLLSIWWVSFAVFLITSICAALLDLSFTFMQRYNRPRVLRLVRRRRSA